MSLADIEQAVFAYYLVSGAPDLTIAPRFYPYGELILIIDDKIQVATRKFGARVSRNTRSAATRFLDTMIAQEAFSTVKNEWGGTMHQFQGDAYKKTLKAFQDKDPIVQAAAAGGADFWQEHFAALAA